MILIADSGSTKTSWRFIQNGETIGSVDTEGYNPYYYSENAILESVKKSLTGTIIFEKVKEIYFYGAGCEGSKKIFVYNALASLFINAAIHLDSDLTAAARALLGDGAGFVCILGTGQNSCYIENGKIVEQLDGLGFLMGDEGSGAYMGKKLLVLYARKAMPVYLMQKFFECYKFLPEDILDQFYLNPLQNRFAASFTRFLYEYIDEIFIRELVDSCFEDYFKNIVCRYVKREQFYLNCVGSIGYHFQEILKEAAHRNGIRIGKIIKEPVENLVTYHLNKSLDVLA